MTTPSVVQDILIVGAGGTSREIADTLRDINALQHTWRLRGFLDDDPNKWGKIVAGAPVLGPVRQARDFSGALVIGISRLENVWLREKIVGDLGIPNSRFATIIHPSARVSSTARIGCGTVILHNSVVTTDVQIGNHVVIQYNCTVAHDAELGDYVTLGPASLIAGSTKVSSGVYVGAGSRVINDIQVGRNAIIGLGAVVLRDVPANVTVVGNPARTLPSRDKSVAASQR